MTQANRAIVHCGGLLIALVSPLGPRPGAIVAYLKLGQPGRSAIRQSDLTWLDAHGRPIQTLKDPFGLCGARLEVPCSLRFACDRPSPPRAASLRWQVDELVADADLIGGADASLRVLYLPLQVPVPGDPHLVATVVNHGERILDFAQGVRESVLLVDGQQYPSAAGGHWDGGYALRPGFSRTHRFGLDDFPGAPRSGLHRMSLRLLGLTSEPVEVDWQAVA